MKKVIIIGFGKIGQLKSRIYNDLGFLVEVVDPVKIIHNRLVKSNNTKQYSLLEDSDYKNTNIFDICVPTESHIGIIEKILKLKSDATILVEKPICSSESCLKNLKRLVKAYKNATIVYSENYVFSSTLKRIKELIDDNGLTIESIECEFTKERREDVQNGRFVDYELGALGIEIPHILMLLKALEIEPYKIKKAVMGDLLTKNGIMSEQGSVILEFETKKKQIIKIFQSLDGIIHVKDRHFAIPDEKNTFQKSYRVMKLQCSSGIIIYAQFEPIQGKQKLTAKIVAERDGKVFADFEFEDDSLRGLIRYMNKVLDKKARKNSLVSVASGINIAEMLIEIKKATRLNERPDTVFKLK